MSALQHLTVDGRPATVAFMSAFDGQLVEQADARVAIVRWDDGSMSYLSLAEPKALGDVEGHEFHGNQWTEGTGHQILQALSDYKQNTAMGVNMYLRGDHTNEQDLSKIVKVSAAMDAAFRDDRFVRPTTKNMTVYRGIDSYRVATHMETMKPGDVIADKAFLSTSMAERIARNAVGDFPKSSVLMEIHVPKGERVIPGRSDEHELILNRETKLELVRTSRVDEHTIYAEMKVIK